MYNHLLNILWILKDIIVSPKTAFKKVSDDKIAFEVCIVFLLGSVIPGIKAFSIDQVRFAFFENHRLDALLTFINNPKIAWILHYISFFIFVIIIGFLCHSFSDGKKVKNLLLSFMAISGAGIVIQFGFILLRLILPVDLYIFYSYFSFFWCSLLAVMAIKYSQNKSLKVSIIMFLLTTIPFLFVFGFAGVFPSIAWLTI